LQNFFIVLKNKIFLQYKKSPKIRFHEKIGKILKNSLFLTYTQLPHDRLIFA